MLTFVAGAMLGCFLGVFLMAMLAMAKDRGVD